MVNTKSIVTAVKQHLRAVRKEMKSLARQEKKALTLVTKLGGSVATRRRRASTKRKAKVAAVAKAEAKAKAAAAPAEKPKRRASAIAGVSDAKLKKLREKAAARREGGE